MEILIEDLPAGSVLSNGTEIVPGVWSLAAGDLSGLTITPPVDSDVDFDLSVSAISTEAQNSTSAVTSGPVSVIVSSAADLPTLTVENASGDEDAVIPLVITAAAANVQDVLTVEVSGLPAGATLSAGTDGGNGTWVLLPQDLAGLSVTSPDRDAAFVLNVTAIATDPSSGNQAMQSATLTVELNAINDPPVHTVPAEQTTSEDGSLVFSVATGNVIRVDGR